MVQFVSPRFDGDPVLEEILADPDTGTKKLGPGSPAESVRRVQQALFDLTWTQRIDTPVSDPTTFVIGIYGPLTTKTVHKYKTHHKIHFPPSAPTGIIDGFAGPRTLAKLDKNTVLLDLCDAELDEKATAVQISSGVEHDSPTLPILGTTGAMRLRSGGGLPGVPSGIWFKRGVGAFQVRGPVFTAYSDENFESGLGFPIADQEAGNQSGQVLQRFEEGEIRVEPDGTVAVRLTPTSETTISSDSF
jgi:hypothetical protein